MGDAYRDENHAAFEVVSHLRQENVALRAELDDLRRRVVVVEHFFEITPKAAVAKRSPRVLAAVIGMAASLGIVFAALGGRAVVHVGGSPTIALPAAPIEREVFFEEPPGPPIRAVDHVRLDSRDPLAAARSDEPTRPASQPKEVLDSLPIGIAECDRYVAKWTACYRDPEVRAMAAPAFNQVKQSWRNMAKNGDGRAALARACATMVENLPTATCN